MRGRYNTINKYDTVNSLGGAVVSVWMQGCPHRCEGCFNPETWDFSGGKELTDEVIDGIIEELKQPHIKGLSVLGGEPLAKGGNFTRVLFLIERAKRETEKRIMIWTGYECSYLKENYSRFLMYPLILYCDYLVCGKFIQDKKDNTLALRGSSNQRIIHFIKELASDLTAEDVTEELDELWKQRRGGDDY